MEKLNAIARLSALAQESRLDVFRLLVQAGHEGRSVGVIADALGLASATLSFHLAQLKHAGLVTVRRDGRSLIYMANFEAIKALMVYLTENCCGGDPSACSVAAIRSAPKRAQISKRGARS